MEATLGQPGRRAAAAASLDQHQVDQCRVLLLGAVEQRQAAVTVAQGAQGGSHPLNG